MSPAYIRENIGFENNKAVAVSWDPLHQDEPTETENPKLKLLTGIMDLLALCVEDPRHAGKIRDNDTAGRNLKTLLHHLGHPLFANQTMRDVAEDAHCTTAAISKTANRFRDEFGIVGVTQREDGIREVSRKRAFAVHKKKADQTALTVGPAKVESAHDQEGGTTL